MISPPLFPALNPRRMSAKSSEISRYCAEAPRSRTRCRSVADRMCVFPEPTRPERTKPRAGRSRRHSCATDLATPSACSSAAVFSWSSPLARKVEKLLVAWWAGMPTWAKFATR
jgi:hypothetical protein